MSRKPVHNYNPAVCDLCGSREYDVLLDLTTGQAVSGDHRIVHRSLKKYICTRCGLVRSGDSLDSRVLNEFYAHDYMLGVQPEHYFYTAAGPVSRSSMLRDWIVSAMGVRCWQTAKRCLEIGAGAGLLMEAFIERFPHVSFEGIELSRAAAALARERGLRVDSVSLGDLGAGTYDIIYAICVIEHVPSPSEFIREIRSRLKPGGWLFLCQPVQDVDSYDLFFIDHIHHFGSEHLRRYAQKCGFRERGMVVGHEYMPNFSLHLWQKTGRMENIPWPGPPAYTTCPATARRVVGDMVRLDEKLDRLNAEGRRVAVFGLGEAYWLICAYSGLGEFPIVCGMDDRPDNPDFSRLGFPVLTPEDALQSGVGDVILTMNRVYYPQACRRLDDLGLVAHRVLS